MAKQKGSWEKTKKETYQGGGSEPDMVLIKDIVIPAGTRFMRAPRKTERNGDGHFSAIFGLTDQTAGEINYYIDPDEDMSNFFRVLK